MKCKTKADKQMSFAFIDPTPAKFKAPELRHILGDGVDNFVAAKLATDCGVRSCRNVELSKVDRIANVKLRIKCGGTETTMSHHIGLQIRGQETNSGNFCFYGYEPGDFQIAALGTMQAVGFHPGVPKTGSLSLSNAMLHDPDFTRVSWEMAVDAHLKMWVDLIRHPDFEGIEYVSAI